MIKIGRSSCIGIRGLSFFPTSQSLPLLYSTSTKEGNPTTSSSSSSLMNFLVRSLRFSNHQSHSTSAKLANKWPVGATNGFDFVENADSVIQFFNQLGFQQSEIRKIVCREPQILVSRVHETLKPKIKLLNDLGLSGSDLVQAIIGNPSILCHRMNPAIEAFRTVLGSDENVISMLKRSYRIDFSSAASYLIPNVELLQNYCGIPIDKIQKFILRRPKNFLVRTDLFRDNLVKVEERLGIPPISVMFLYGIHLVTCVSEKDIEDKCKIFESFGWSQSDVMKLIRQNPLCFTYAEERMKERLGFLMNKLGYKPDYLASRPLLFICSMEKRLLPRLRVLQFLKDKGHLRMRYHLSSAIGLTESLFLKRFVLPFEEVHEVYALLTGSTVGSLNVRRAKSQILKVSSNSDAA